jgi:hypothetical protein
MGKVFGYLVLIKTEFKKLDFVTQEKLTRMLIGFSGNQRVVSNLIRLGGSLMFTPEDVERVNAAQTMALHWPCFKIAYSEKQADNYNETIIQEY